jgi:hypothetical protein
MRYLTGNALKAKRRFEYRIIHSLAEVRQNFHFFAQLWQEFLQVYKVVADRI